MPSNATAKTKSGHSRARALVFFSAAVSVLLIRAVLPYGPPTATLRLHGHTLSLQIADTAQARAQGLSGKAAMDVNQGMLFTYQEPTKQCFWMKGMHFPLDMIWLNADMRVVYLKQRLSPRSYPELFCTPTAAQYVIELNGGVSRTLGVHEGAQLHF